MRDRRGRWGLTSGLAGCGVILSAGFAVAQSAPASQSTPTREQLNPAGQTEAAVRRRPSDLFSAPPVEACALPSDPSLSFTLTGVDVNGTKALSSEALHDVASDMIGRQITPADLCHIRDRIAARLFQKSVLARVVIPKQQINGGRVAFTVIEAQIVSVRYHGDIGPVQGKVETYLNHLRGLAPFDLDTAQHYLLLANDLPGVHVSAALSHSTSQDAPLGGLDLDIALSRTAIDEIVAVQNTNSRTLGRWSGIARVDFNSFTHFGERTSLIAYSTLENNAQQVVEVIEQARVGGGGMFAQGSFAYGRSHPGDILTPLHLVGNSYVGTFELDDPLIRLKRLKWTAALGFDLISQSTIFPGGGALSDDNLRIVWLRSDAAAQHVFANDVLGSFVTATADLSLQVRKGLHILGASGSTAPASSRIEGHSDAWVLRAVGGVGLDAKPLNGGIPFALTAHVEGQWADRPLLAYEEQAIGNLTVGRGYDPAAATGDRVIAAELKAKFGPFAVAKSVSVAPYGFYDIARVTNLDQGSIDVTLHSVGGGVEFRLPYGVRADVAYAKPLDKPFPAAQSIPPGRVLVQLVVVH